MHVDRRQAINLIALGTAGLLTWWAGALTDACRWFAAVQLPWILCLTHGLLLYFNPRDP